MMIYLPVGLCVLVLLATVAIDQYHQRQVKALNLAQEQRMTAMYAEYLSAAREGYAKCVNDVVVAQEQHMRYVAEVVSIATRHSLDADRLVH